MVVILINSRKRGRSGWVNVRGSYTLLCRGLAEADILRLDIWGGSKDGEDIMITHAENTEILLPTDAKFVRIEHIEASGNPVDVDLVRI